MMISSDYNFTNSKWEPFKSHYKCYSDKLGENKIYFKFKNIFGEISDVINKDFILRDRPISVVAKVKKMKILN